jgi:hypothetical protein
MAARPGERDQRTQRTDKGDAVSDGLFFVFGHRIFHQSRRPPPEL